MKTIILLLSMLAFNVIADPNDKIYLDVHLASLHTKSNFVVDGEQYNLNQKNFGLGITFPVYSNRTGKADANASYRFGFYKNSYNDISMYGGIDLHTKYTNGFGTGAILGLVNGYKNSPTKQDFGFAIIPHVQYIYNSYKAEVAYLSGKYTQAVTLTISYSF